MTKKDPLVIHIKDWIDGQYAEGRQTVISDSELEALVSTFEPEV